MHREYSIKAKQKLQEQRHTIDTFRKVQAELRAHNDTLDRGYVDIKEAYVVATDAQVKTIEAKDQTIEAKEGCMLAITGQAATREKIHRWRSSYNAVLAEIEY